MLFLAAVLVPVLVTQVAAHPHRRPHHPWHGDDESSSAEIPESSAPPASTETMVPTSTVDPSSTAAPTSTTAPSSTATAIPSPTAGLGVVAPPPVDGKADYQIGGTYSPESGVKVVSRDHTESPVDGLYNICYVNAFQTQPDAESFWKNGTRDVLLLRNSGGDYFGDAAWEGEIFLDTSTAEKRTQIAEIVKGWISECAQKGFSAVEPDNLDTYDRSEGLLTKDNNVALAKLLADHAHSLGLAIAQKNTAELTEEDKTNVGFDFAVAEECEVWGECDAYTNLYGKHVIEIEYTDSDDAQAVFDCACAARGSDISILYRDRNVAQPSNKAYHYEEC